LFVNSKSFSFVVLFLHDKHTQCILTRKRKDRTELKDNEMHQAVV